MLHVQCKYFHFELEIPPLKNQAQLDIDECSQLSQMLNTVPVKSRNCFVFASKARIIIPSVCGNLHVLWNHSPACTMKYR